VRKADNLPPSCALSRNLGTLTSWNPLGPSEPVTGLLYIYLRISEEIPVRCYVLRLVAVYFTHVALVVALMLILLLCYDSHVTLICDSEVCHPHCVFKLYGEMNSVKNTTINYG